MIKKILKVKKGAEKKLQSIGRKAARAVKNYKAPATSLKKRQRIWAEGGGGNYPTK